MSDSRPEVWLRGPVAGVPPLLQPVAHALLQAREEVDRITEGYPARLLWTRPAGLASVGFHLQHLTGVLDRLFTYARAEELSDAQRRDLAREADPGTPLPGMHELLAAYHRRVERAIGELGEWREEELTDAREVGRARLPSTVLGLLVHAAEHSQRHVGQLLVTARVQHPGSRA